MTTRVYLIRHGATELSAEDRFSGGTDIDLSEDGRWQAACLAQRLADDDISAFYSSPMRRTIATAAIISAPYQMQPAVKDGLQEIHHGRWETMRRSEVEQQYPEEYAAWQEDPFTFAPLGGESGLMVMARSLPVIREIVLNHAGQSVAIVSHKATIRLILSSLLGFDARGYRDRLDQSPACLNILDFKDAVRARLMLFNDVSHYVDQPPYSSNRLSNWFDNSTRVREESCRRARVKPRCHIRCGPPFGMKILGNSRKFAACSAKSSINGNARFSFWGLDKLTILVKILI
jgi:broad specificity phosphatase PhoE